MRSKGTSIEALIAGIRQFTEKLYHYPRMGKIYTSERDGNTK
jgi:hypothetical protein